MLKKAKSITVFLRRKFKTCPRKIKQQSYRSMHVKFGIISQNNDTNKIEITQRRAAHLVYGDCRTTSFVTSMLNSLQWGTLQHRRQDLQIAMLYRIINALLAIPTNSCVPTLPDPILFRAVASTSRFSLSISVWNSLPYSVVTASNLDRFKERLHISHHTI
jgi:hypothetical protein